MPRRLAALFARYAGTHLDVAICGPDLHDGAGRMIGHVDQIRLRGNRLHVTGWTLARGVRLQAGAAEVSVRPTILRQDVQDALGVNPAVGFMLDVPFDPSGAMLVVETAGGEPQVTPLPPLSTDRARLRLWARFLRDLVRALPAVVGWRMTRNPRYRSRIKALLGLGMAHRAGPMEARLFDHPGQVAPAPAVEGLSIILPVYNAFDLLPEVLDRLRDNTDLPWHLVVIEDCSTDARVRPFLRDWVARHGTGPDGVARVRLIENDRNLGFIGSVNSGLAVAIARGHHVVLLNSDAFVPPGWASRLIRPILMHEDVATVTPMSNDAEIFSVPAICTRTVLAPGMGDAIDRVARSFNPEATLSVAPTGVGFCMAMNLAFLQRLPALDPIFGRGYGEEVDWCQKARALGGRHLGLPGLFVEHRGGESFGSEAKRALVARNNAIVSRRYPGYDNEVQAFVAADPLVTARVALALAWAAAWGSTATQAGPETRGAADEPADEAGATPAEPDLTAWSGPGEGPGDGPAPPSAGESATALPRTVPVYLAHSLSGGAEKYLEHRIAADLAALGRPAVVLRVGGPVRWRIEVITPTGRVSGTTEDFGFVRRLLGLLPRRQIVYSCGVGDVDPVTLPAHLLALRQSAPGGPGDRIEVLFHDFFPLSPSYTLLDSDGCYRGPLRPGRDALPGGDAHTAPRPDGGVVSLSGWQEAWWHLLAAADEVVVFSQDSRTQVLSVYPDVADRLVIRPHRLHDAVPRLVAPSGARRVIGVLGNIGRQKGAGVVRDLAQRLTGPQDPGLVLIGNIDPAFVLPPHVPVHGDYRIADLPALVARYGITDWLIPSVWPETFSYTTREALATGLPVYAFHIGAQGEAVSLAPNGHPVHFDPEGDLAGNILHEMATRLEVAPVKELT